MGPYLFEIGQVVQLKVIQRSDVWPSRELTERAQILYRWVVDPTGEVVYEVRMREGKMSRVMQCEIEPVSAD